MIYNNKKIPHIVVFGSINIDHFIDVEKLPLVGETILGSNGFTCIGGKGANTALTCSQLGAKTTFICTIGPDSASLFDELKEKGVNMDLINHVPKCTGQAFIFSLPDGKNSIIVNSGANFSWPPLTKKQIKAIQTCDYVLLQREIPSEVNLKVAEIANKSKIPVFLDAGGQDTPIPLSLLSLISIFSPNETEISRLIQVNGKTKEQWATELREKFGIKQVLLKLGEHGAYYEHAVLKLHHPAFKVKVVDTTGAGDCFTGAFAVRLASKFSIHECLKFACAAGGLQVTKKGTIPSIPTLSEVEMLMNDKEN